MKLPSYLKRSRHQVFYFRYVIPQALRAFFNGRQEIKWSLRTRDPIEAKRLSRLLVPRLDAWRARVGVGMADRDLFSAGRVVWNPKDGLTVETEPGNEKDAEQALRALEKLTPVIEAQQALAVAQAQEWLLAAAPAAPTGPLLSAVIDDYLKFGAENWRADTLADYRATLNLFTKIVGDQPITGIGKTEIKQFKNTCYDDMSARTLDKKLMVIHGLFEAAIKDGDYTEANPAAKQRILKKKQRKRDAWKELDAQELQAVFDPNSYLANNRKPHQHWGPLIGLLSAMRIEEICQLRLKNVVTELGVLQFVVEETEDDQSTKTEASERRVPVHQQLIDLGFVDYIKDVKELAGREALLFPYLIKTKNGYSKTLSQHFGEYLGLLGIHHPKKVFHSLRKNANDCLKHNRVAEERRCQLLGQEHPSINSEIYSTPFSAKFLADEVMPFLTFPALDLAPLKYDAEIFRPRLQAEMTRRQRADAHAAARQERQARTEPPKP